MRKSFLSQGCVGFGLAFEPGLGLGEQIGRRHDLVDDAHAQCGLRIDALAFEHEGQRGHGADHARQALRAAAARDEADLGLRKADARLRIVGHDAIVAGERELQPAAERGSVHRGDDGFLAGFELAEGRMQGGHHLERGGCGILPARAAIGEHLVEIGAGAKAARLSAGDDEALDGGIRRHLVRDFGELGDRRHRQNVERAVGHVPDERDDTVGVLVPLEIDEVHRSDPLDDRRRAHARSDAERDEAGGKIAPLQFVERRSEDHGACCAERVAERDGAAVHVQFVVRHFQLAHEAEHDRGEGLIDLVEVDVVLRHAGAVQDLARDIGGRRQHDAGFRADRGEGLDARARFQAELPWPISFVPRRTAAAPSTIPEELPA